MAGKKSPVKPAGNLKQNQTPVEQPSAEAVFGCERMERDEDRQPGKD